MSVFVALVLFSTITALLHLAGRKSWTQRENSLVAELTDARAALDRANVFLAVEPQIVVSWTSATSEPEIEGDLSLVIDAPVPRRVLGFGSWLAAGPAQDLEHCVERLRSRGESFRLALVSQTGRHIEADGRAIGGRAVMRLRDISGDRLELIRLREIHAHAQAELDGLRAMLDAVPNVVWVRAADGKLTWVNTAYVRAVEARDPRDAVARGLELLDSPARAEAAKARSNSTVWRVRVPAVVAGARHMLDVIDVPSSAGSVGLASDLSEIEAVRADLVRQTESHARTLDQLSTAVAIFDQSRRLVFFNSACRLLWSLDEAFLEQLPTDGEVLDRLRVARRIPEQVDFRAWKAALMAAYQSPEPISQVWYLPDRRTLRVVASPNVQGGVTYLFDDVTEQYRLASQYHALDRVQETTLDSLKEGVAVFGSDGRLKLFNPAFASFWRLDAKMLQAEPTPHIDQVARLCAELFPDEEVWSDIRSIISGLHDARTAAEWRMSRSDGSVIDTAAAPLPDGATLLTFIDVTASVNVERALTERNQALIDAEKLRNDFVHHVSYELRSPLTNIIGFIQLLGDAAIGPLNAKQHEYAGYVLKSSAALLAIINDILDLATIDRDAMELTLGDVDIAGTIAAAAEGVQDRLAESQIQLQIVAADGIGSFQADAKRIRQILFNLLSNAIGFSASGQTVTLAAIRRGSEVVFKVSDEGRGIPPETVDRVFDRFHSQTAGSRHRGVGLGLSIVRSFVELHGGRVLIETAPGEGTTVTCIFPANGIATANGAEVA
ncbi:MAG TPA: ATP-binding protein [Beijerinckiaceae bacterium]|nr:ATP-binding protein [Beijerinckiaceae bacterium]